MGVFDNPVGTAKNWKEFVEFFPKWLIAALGVLFGLWIALFGIKDLPSFLGKQVVDIAQFQNQQEQLKTLKDQATELQKVKSNTEAALFAGSENSANEKKSFESKLERASGDLAAAKTQEIWCKQYATWVNSVINYVSQIQTQRTQLLTYQTCFLNSQLSRQCTEQELTVQKVDYDSRISEYLSIVRPHQEQLGRCFSK